MKDFAGRIIFSHAPCCQFLNGRKVVRTIQKAFPEDKESTLYIVKVEGTRAYQQLYEDKMIE